ncbi:hypothetical protein Tco_0797729 [Tanacetum coccineum]
MYLINNQRIRHPIGLKKSNNGHWKLTGTNWSRFINRSGYGDIATLHFISEGADTFYVTGYDEHGSEIGGYNDLMTQQRRSRILVTLGNNPGESPKGHSVVHEDEEVMFYWTLSRHVKNEGSLAIPPDFVTVNDLFIFEHAKIVYGKKSYRLDMKIVRNWRRISHRCMFGKNKTIRLKYLTDMLDKRVVKTCRQDPVMNHVFQIEVYVENNTMEVVLGTGKGVVIEEAVKDDKVKEASETGNSGKQLLSVTENDVQTKTEPLTPPWSFESLYDSDISDHPPCLDFSHETLEMKNEVKAEHEMEEPVHNDFHPLMYEDDLLQKKDPVNYQQDPYHGEDVAEENVELFDEQDHLLEHVPFLKETVVIVDGDAPILVVDALVVPRVIVLDEQLERPNKRRKLNPA